MSTTSIPFVAVTKPTPDSEEKQDSETGQRPSSRAYPYAKRSGGLSETKVVSGISSMGAGSKDTNHHAVSTSSIPLDTSVHTSGPNKRGSAKHRSPARKSIAHKRDSQAGSDGAVSDARATIGNHSVVEAGVMGGVEVDQLPNPTQMQPARRGVRLH